MFTRTLRKSAGLILLILLVSFLAGCNEPIPSKDLQDAKQAIAVAEAAKASKYDPDNLQAAKDAFGKALKMVVEDETPAARKLALDAKQKADTATENSRKKLAEETIKEAEALLVKADQQRAGFLAATQYRLALTKLEDAKRAFSEGKYVQAYTDAENSKEASGQAIDEANKKLAALRSAYNDADLALKRALASDVVKKYASTELDAVQKTFQQGEEDKKKVEDPSLITAGSKEMRDNMAKDAYDRSLQAAQNTIDGVSNVFRLALQREQEEYRRLANSKLEEAKRLLLEIEKLKQQGLIKSQVLPQPEPAGDSSTNSSSTNSSSASNTAPTNVMVTNNSMTNTSSSNTSTTNSVSTNNSMTNTSSSNTTSTNTGSTNSLITNTSSSNISPTNTAALSDRERYEAALKALQQAETTFQSQNYLISIKNSEEAIRLAKLIKALMQTGGKFYVVKAKSSDHDCLWRIASYGEHYGDPSLWPKIWKANKHLIVDPDLIYPGQKFVIPPKD